MSMNEELGLSVPLGAFGLILADGKEHTLHPLSVSRFRIVRDYILQFACKDKDDEAAKKAAEAEQGTAFLAALIWQALLPDNPELTVEQGGDLIPAGWLTLDKTGLNKLMTALDIKVDISEAQAEADPMESTTSQPA